MTSERSWRALLGVPSLLASVFGGLLFALSLRTLVRDALSADPEAVVDWSDPWLAASVALIGLGCALQWLREGSRAVPALEPASPAHWRAAGIGLLALFGFVAVGWIQFELRFEEIRTFPVLTFGVAIAFSLYLGRAMCRGPYRSTARMLLVAIVGIPLGILATVVPGAHYRYHGSALLMTSPRGAAGTSAQTHRLEPDLPQGPSKPLTGEGTRELLEAFATAEPVDVEAKLESGEWIKKNGLYYRVLEDGSHELIVLDSGAEVLDRMEVEAARKDRDQWERMQREHEEELRRRREGGRLFD